MPTVDVEQALGVAVRHGWAWTSRVSLGCMLPGDTCRRVLAEPSVRRDELGGRIPGACRPSLGGGWEGDLDV